MDGYLNMDEVWLRGAGTVLIVEDKPMCAVVLVGDGVGEKERDTKSVRA